MSRSYVGDKLYENIPSPKNLILHCGIFSTCCSSKLPFSFIQL